MRRAWILAGLLVATACTRAVRPPDLGELYDRAAQAHGPERNPVVLVPGILGSTLRQQGTGELVWGAFGGGSADPRSPEGARLLALPMREGAALAELVDDVEATAALESFRVRFLGLPFGVEAYARILSALGVGGYRDESLGLAGAVDYGGEHFTCFQFPYDWRRDVPENAARLAEYLREKREYVRGEYSRRYGLPDADVRFDLVAHSMGGLVARYLLRYGGRPLPADGSAPVLDWSGCDLVERVVLVAPPNAGTVSMFEQLVEGWKPGPFLPRYPAAVLGTMPSTYQLLARPRHGAYVDMADTSRSAGDALDPALWARLGWGLADPAAGRVLARLLPDVRGEGARRRIALDHQAKCLARARRVFEALDRPGAPPPGTDLILVAGDAVSTPSSVAVDLLDGAWRYQASAPGDGRVTRASALLDERSAIGWRPRLSTPLTFRRVLFLFDDHLGLTRDPAFIDNLLYTLLEEPRSPR